MHDQRSIYDKALEIAEIVFEKELNEQGNFKFYPNPPKMGDKQVVTLSLCPESSGIDPEDYFLSRLKTDYHGCFPDPHIARYK